MNDITPPQLVTLSGASALVSWLPQLDLYLRIGASAVAIISGLVWIYYKVKEHRQKA